MGSDSISPYAGDEIAKELRKHRLKKALEDGRGNHVGGDDVRDPEDEIDDEDEEEEIDARNKDLDEILDFYDAYDLLPVAQHVMWLASVKEALGYIPFRLDYFAIRCLVIFKEEVNKKSIADSQRMQEDARSVSRGSFGNRAPIGLDRALIKR